MVRILVRFEIQDERRKSEDAQRGRSEDRAFQAMRRLFTQDPPRRPSSAGEMVRNVIKKALDPGGRLERAQPTKLE